MSNAQDWRDIISEIKDWVVSERLEEHDRPTPLAAMDAIAYAEAAVHHPPPSVVDPSGDGCIALEWHGEEGYMYLMLEFDGSGHAIRTRCGGGQMIDKTRVQIREKEQA